MNKEHTMIEFNKPSLLGNELLYIQQAIENAHISGDGPFTKKCHAFLENKLGVSKVLLTTSGTHALEMAALLLDIQLEDDLFDASEVFDGVDDGDSAGGFVGGDMAVVCGQSADDLGHL